MGNVECLPDDPALRLKIVVLSCDENEFKAVVIL